MSVAKQLKVKEGDKLDWEFASENVQFEGQIRIEKRNKEVNALD